MKLHVLYICLALNTLYVTLCIGKMTELELDKVMLLNVAIKGRLVNKLTSVLSTMQSTRRALVEDVQDCLIKVSASQVLCKNCVREKCEKRAAECRVNVKRLDMVLQQDQKADISGLDFIGPNAEIVEGIDMLSGEAKNDILSEIPYEMREEAEKVMEQEKTQSKLEILQNSIKKTVGNLPNLIPKVKEAISTFNSKIEDPETLNNLADTAAKQVAVVMEGEKLAKEQIEKGQELLNDHLPRIMSSVENQVSRMMSAFGSFVKSTKQQLKVMTGDTTNTNGVKSLPEFINMPQKQGESGKFSNSVMSIHIINPDGKITHWKNNQQSASVASNPQVGDSQREDMAAQQNVPVHEQLFSAIESSINQALQSAGGIFSKHLGNVNTNAIDDTMQPIKTHVIGGIIQPVQQQTATNSARPVNLSGQLQNPVSRGKRSIPKEADCKQIVEDPQAACKNYHFQCNTCLNESVLLQHSCGKEALKTMIDIKQIDMKTAAYLVAYEKDVKHGLIVKKVDYDERSYDRRLKAYQSAIITAKIGKRVITYETSSLPNLADIVATGGQIGDEIWQILEAGDEFDPGQFVNEWKQDNQETMAMTHDGKSSAAVTCVMWSVIGTVMYMGFQAI